MNKYPIAGPEISNLDIEAVARATREDWFANANRSVVEFEQAFAKHTQRRYAIALPSCTSAIHLALLSLNLGKDDQVIVPDMTWIASSAPIEYVGAKVVFVDIDLHNWCIAADAIAAAICQHTKAIIAVDLYGSMPEWDKILSIAKQKNIFVIEDAAEAIGSKYKNKPAGSFGDVSVFSFHASKTITTGEGGMLVTDRKDLFEKMLILRDHGRNPGDKNFFNDHIAFKYKMSSMQAALGLSQLSRLDKFIDKKRLIFNAYQQELSNVPDITLNPVIADVFSSYWMVCVILGKTYTIAISKLREKLLARGVDTRPCFHPLSSLPAYKEHIINNQAILNDTPVAYAIGPHGLNLPSSVVLTEDDIKDICNIFKDCLYE